MKKTRANGWVAGCLVLLCVAGTLTAGTAAITRASKDRVLAFVRPGTIMELPVEEGQVVKEGQLLMRQDDRAEREQLSSLVAEAENTTRVKAAEAQLAQKRVSLQLMEKAARSGAATPLEMDQARVEVVIADLSLDLARFEHEQAQRKVKETQAQIDRMQLLSPIDGIVEVLQVREGETVDGTKPVIRVVKVDPLWVDVPVPVDQAAKIHLGQKAFVSYGDPYLSTEPGEVIHITAVVDAGSNTRRVRVNLPNPKMRPCGLHVTVDFPEEAASQPVDATSKPSIQE